MGRNPMGKGCNLSSALFWILVIVFIFGGLAVLQSKFKFMGELSNPFESKPAQVSVPAMPEVKSKELKTINSPVLKQALKQKLSIGHRDKLRKKDILFWTTGSVKDAEAIDFFNELLADEGSQKIFREFTKAGINIYLIRGYDISSGAVWIDVRDGVKKVAKWLATGKK
jgi:hypothetical protein